ncbi:TPA: thrombospondin type-1 domain-containing protein [Aeromonas veronii]
MSAWGGCSNGCGTGTQTRTVVCKAKNGVTVSDVYCSSSGTKPPTSQPCQGVTSCGYSWSVGGWSACSNNCSGGYQTRDIFCRRSDGSAVPDNYCGAKPAAIQQCSNPSAPECQPKEEPTHIVTVGRYSFSGVLGGAGSVDGYFKPNYTSQNDRAGALQPDLNTTSAVATYSVNPAEYKWCVGSWGAYGSYGPRPYGTIKIISTGQQYDLGSQVRLSGTVMLHCGQNVQSSLYPRPPIGSIVPVILR